MRNAGHSIPLYLCNPAWEQLSRQMVTGTTNESEMNQKANRALSLLLHGRRVRAALSALGGDFDCHQSEAKTCMSATNPAISEPKPSLARLAEAELIILKD
jgi:hypothetical protein